MGVLLTFVLLTLLIPARSIIVICVRQTAVLIFNVRQAPNFFSVEQDFFLIMILPRNLLPLSEGDLNLILEKIRDRKRIWNGFLCPESFPQDPYDLCSIVFFFPYLFRSLFNINDSKKNEMFCSFSVASILFSYSIFMLDKIIDDRYENDFHLTNGPKYALNLQSLQFESYGTLYKLFPPISNYWKFMRESIIAYHQAVLIEMDFSTEKYSLDDFTDYVAMNIINGKNKMFENIPYGLCVLFEYDKYLNNLIDSVKSFMVAEQIIDDLQDWKKDLLQKTPSLVLSRLIRSFPKENHPDVLKKLSYRLFYEGHAEEIIKIALNQIYNAENAVIDTPVPEWKKVILAKRNAVESLLSDITAITSKGKKTKL